MRVFLPPGFIFRDNVGHQTNHSMVERSVKAVTDESSLAFEYVHASDVALKQIEKRVQGNKPLLIQVQIHYTRLDGEAATRIMTHALECTS